MKKNYGALYLYGKTNIKELQTKTVREPSEEMLEEAVERGFKFIQETVSPQARIPDDDLEQIEMIKMTLRLGLKEQLTVGIDPQDGYTRIESESFHIHSITEVAKKYSIQTNLPTLFWSGFDDSIMILGVADHGEIQTVHIVSDEEFDDSSLASKNGDGNIFKKYIPVKDEEAFVKLLLEKDVFTAQDLVLLSFDIVPPEV